MRRLRYSAVITATALLGLAACSGGEDKAPAAGAQDEVTSSTAPAAGGAAALPTDGGVTPAPDAVANASADAVAAPASPVEAAAAAGGASLVVAGFTGDVARGQRVFMQCRTCHAIEPGVNRAGPSLHGIVGRESGTVPNFRYSNANKNSNVTWDEATLFTYLENPREFMPGTTMSFVGLKQPQQRADVIAYLKTQG